MDYPGASDVETIVTQAGLTAPAGACAAEIAAVIALFEDMTGYKPFWVDVDADPGEWRFDPPEYGEHLDFRGAFVEVVGITTGVYGSYSGTDLNEGADYVLVPENAESEGRGWTGVRFTNRPSGPKGSIVVDGARGLYTDLPSDVFYGLAKEAAARVIARMPASEVTDATGAIEKIKQGARELTYAKGGGSTGSASAPCGPGMLPEFNALIARYRRQVV